MTTAHDLLQRHIQTLVGDHERRWRMRWVRPSPVDSFKIMVLGMDSHLTNERAGARRRLARGVVK